jgi:tetratricopeptide (TPR) repeat protein
MKKLLTLLSTAIILATVTAQVKPKPKSVAKPSVKPVVKANAAAVNALLAAGTKLTDDRKYQPAIAKFNQALKLDPQNVKVFKEKIYCLGMLDQKETVVAEMQKFFKNIDTTALYLSFTGFNLPEEKGNEQGMYYATEAIRINPQSPYGYGIKAVYEADKGDMNEAYKSIEQALKNKAKGDESFTVGMNI